MTALSTKAAEVLESLRINTEGSTENPVDGSVWGLVYLDNAHPSGMSAHAFAGYLSALEAAKLYRSHNDGAFGSVRLAPAAKPKAAKECDAELDALLGEWVPHPEDPDASKLDAELIRNRRR